MLKGYFKLPEGYTYYLRGYDFGDNLVFYLSTDLVKAKKFIDKGILIETENDAELIPATWEDLFISVGSGNISTDCYMEVTDDGKKYKNRLNSSFFITLGSLIRGMISSCNNSNRTDILDFDTAGFNPQQSITYEIPEMGSVTLKMRILQRMEVSYNGMKLFLEEDGQFLDISRNTKILQRFKLDLSAFSNKTQESNLDWEFEDDVIFSLQEIIERNPDKSYIWLKDRVYHIVNDLKEVEEVCKKIYNHNGIVSFDTETTGLNINVMSRFGGADRLVGMVFSIEPGEAWYFPVSHKKIKNICTPDDERYIIEKYFKPILETKEILCQNGAFDWKVMYVYNILLNLKQDTYILAKVTIWNDHRALNLGLKSLTSLYLHRDSFELSDFVQGKWGSGDIKFWDLDEESVKYYACPDTDNALELFNTFMNMGLLQQYGATKTYEIEVAFSIVIAYQEFYGHCVDITKIDSLVKDIKKTKEEEYKAMVNMVGHDFNPNSSKDLQQIVFKELNYPVISYTDTGAPSCGKDARNAWMSYTNPDDTPKYPFAGHLHRWKEASTLESNFTKNIDKFATEDGLMFSQVQQFLETGRVSVKDPNYQSYSDVVKKYIIPRTGYYALDADYSSVEARIMVSMAGCKGMVEKLKDPDADYHTAKASDMFNVPYELVTSKLRKQSKGVNFGILYGLGDPNLGANLYGEVTPENTIKARKMKKLYFKGMPELEGFINYSQQQGVNNGYSETFFHRRRYYDRRKTNKNKIERQSGNARIQGTAADIYKIAMINLFHTIKKNGLTGKILISAFVHDECFLEVSKSIDPCKMLKMLRECMMLEIDGWCPLYIGSGFGVNWYTAKKTEIPVQVQEIMVNTWGETGLDWWNGDTERLYDWEIRQINKYKTERIISYLKNPENHGKLFNPIENGLTHDVVSEIENKKPIDSVVCWEVTEQKDMLENLKMFCKAFGLEELFEEANIQEPDYSNISQDTTDSDVSYYEEENTVDPKELVNMKLNQLGVAILNPLSDSNEETTKLYFDYRENDKMLMNAIYQSIKRNPGDVEVFAIKNGEEFSTGMKTSLKAYPEIIKLYLNRSNVVRRAKR